MKIGTICRASVEGDEYDGSLIRVLSFDEDGEMFVKVLSGPMRGSEDGPWDSSCVIELSALEQLALEAK